MVSAISPLINSAPSLRTSMISLITSLAIPIISKKYFPSATYKMQIPLAFITIFGMLQWNSKTSAINLIFNTVLATAFCSLGVWAASGGNPTPGSSTSPTFPKPFNQEKSITIPEQAVILKQIFQNSAKTSSETPTSQAIVTHSTPTLQKTRYRAREKKTQIQARKDFYQALKPLIENFDHPIMIPCLKDYEGKSPQFQFKEGVLVINTIFWGSRSNSIEIFENGDYNFNVNNLQITDNTTSFSIRNGEEIFLKDNNARFSKDQNNVETIEFINHLGNVQSTHKKQVHLDQANALMEFLIFKQNHITSSLNNDAWNQQLATLQRNILSIFEQIRNSNSPNLSTQAITTPSFFPLSEAITLGPIWSPVATSQDSLFYWTVRRDDQDKIDLVFEKKSRGRGHMSGSSSRKIIFQQSAEKKLLVHLQKADSNDIQNSSSHNSYELKFSGAGLHFVPLQSKSESFYCFGGDVFKNETDQLPPDQMKADFELIIGSLISIGDIIQSPDSVILDTETGQATLLTGDPIPDNQLEQLKSLQQGEASNGISLGAYHKIRNTPDQQKLN